MAAPQVLAIVLAGGEGKRLMPLTAHRAKPAVPFGGIYRLVDFALSNLVNSHYLHIVVLTQYKSHSLDRHISKTWRMSALLGNYVAPVPAQQRVGKHWYLGSAPTRSTSASTSSRTSAPTSSSWSAPTTSTAWTSPRWWTRTSTRAPSSRSPASASRSRWPTEFGVIDTDPADPDKIRAFLEKPTDPVGLADSPGEILASMGNYVVNADALVEAVTEDADNLDVAARHGRRHRPVLRRPRDRRRLRLHPQRRPRLDRPRPRLLARRRDHRLVLRGEQGPHRRHPGLQPLQRRVAAAHGLHRPPAGEVRARRRRAARPRRRLDRLPRCAHLGRDGRRLGALPRRAPALLGGRVRQRPARRRPGAPARPGAPGDRRQERHHQGARPRRARTPSTTAPAASRSPSRASRWSPRARSSSSARADRAVGSPSSTEPASAVRARLARPGSAPRLAR